MKNQIKQNKIKINGKMNLKLLMKLFQTKKERKIIKEANRRNKILMMKKILYLLNQKIRKRKIRRINLKENI